MTTYARWWVEDESKPYSDDWFWSYWHVLGSSGRGDPDREGWPTRCGRWIVTHHVTTTEIDPLPANWVLPPGGKPDNFAAPMCKTCARSRPG